MKRRNPWPARLAAAAVGAAAAAAVVLVVTRNDQQQADATVAVTGSDLGAGYQRQRRHHRGQLGCAHRLLRARPAPS